MRREMHQRPVGHRRAARRLGDLACLIVAGIASFSLVGLAPARFGIAATPEDQLAATQPSAASLTRGDLADAYLFFEQVYAEHPPAAARVAEVNRAFDRVTLQFFAGDRASMVRALNDLTFSLLPAEIVTPAWRNARSVRLRPDPSILVAGVTRDLMVQVEAIGSAVPAASELAARIQFVRGTETGPAIDFDAMPASDLIPPDAIPGDWGFATAVFWQDPAWTAVRVELLEPKPGGTGRVLRSITLPVVPGDLDSIRLANRGRLAALSEKPSSRTSGGGESVPRNVGETGEAGVSPASLADARETCAARNELLRSESIEGAPGPYPVDLRELHDAVERELRALESGVNPYRGHVGHLWRTLRAGTGDIAFRVYAPARAKSDDAMPLVIALHGAGGDENMFMEGYGAGRLCRLADERGFVVASPRTLSIAWNPIAFDRIVEALLRDYPIDRSRVYVIGHSLGAGVALALGSQRADAIAAICAMAGGGDPSRFRRFPRTLLIHGGLDPIAGAGRRRGNGADRDEVVTGGVVRRVFAEHGHTLLVADTLPEAIDWLLKP